MFVIIPVRTIFVNSIPKVENKAIRGNPFGEDTKEAKSECTQSVCGNSPE